MDEDLQKNVQGTTSKSSVLIRQFLAAVAEVHGREMTPLLVGSYESALAHLPESDLRETLNATLRESKFWPTPGHLHEVWEARHAAKDKAGAEQAWELVIKTVYGVGRTYAKGFDNPTGFALRSIGGYLALCNTIPESEHRFVRKTFIEAFCRFRETGGYLAPSRTEAAALVHNLERRLEANQLADTANEVARKNRQHQQLVI